MQMPGNPIQIPFKSDSNLIQQLPRGFDTTGAVSLLAKDISHNDAPLKRQVQTYIAGDVGRFQLEISMEFLRDFYVISMGFLWRFRDFYGIGLPGTKIEKHYRETLWLCQNSYWKWWFIVDFTIENGDFP